MGISCHWLSDELVLVGVGGGRRTRGHAQLDEDVADVPIHRPLAEDQLSGDVPRGSAGGDQLQHSSRGVSPLRASTEAARPVSESTRARPGAAPSCTKAPRAASSSNAAVSWSPTARQASPSCTRARAASCGAWSWRARIRRQAQRAERSHRGSGHRDEDQRTDGDDGCD